MKLSDQKGQAMVELALLLPLLLSVVLGITEFGRAFYIKSTLVNAARVGARMASIRPAAVPQDDATLKTYVKNILPAFAQTELLDVKNTAASLHGQDTITVVVKLPFQSIVPKLIPQLEDITLEGQASMLYE